MSSVLARYRNISEMEFYENMNKIQKEFYDLLMGKSTPKKCKYTHVLPTMTAIEEALDCMVKANNIYPYEQELLDEKKELQNNCIRICDVLYRRLQSMINTVWYQKLHQAEDCKSRQMLEKRIERLSFMLEREEALLKGWRKKAKLLSRPIR